MDGDMTDLVEVSGEVIWYQPGTYELVYTVTDSSGNTTSEAFCKKASPANLQISSALCPVSATLVVGTAAATRKRP